MSTTKRVKTSRTSCECGKGEFLFYACEADRWLFVDSPRETWFEMHIRCDTCSGLFQRYRLTPVLQVGSQMCWKLTIPVADQVPQHQPLEELLFCY